MPIEKHKSWIKDASMKRLSMNFRNKSELVNDLDIGSNLELKYIEKSGLKQSEIDHVER